MLDFLVTFCCQSDPAKSVGPSRLFPTPQITDTTTCNRSKTAWSRND